MTQDDRAAYAAAAMKSDPATAAVIVGEAVDLVQSVEPAAAMTTRIAGEARHILSGAAERLWPNRKDDTMIDFYTWSTSNGRKVAIGLEEMGLAYRVHPIDIYANAQFDPAFAAISANAKIPAIVDARRGRDDVRIRRDPDPSGREDRAVPARVRAAPGRGVAMADVADGRNSARS